MGFQPSDVFFLGYLNSRRFFQGGDFFNPINPDLEVKVDWIDGIVVFYLKNDNPINPINLHLEVRIDRIEKS